MWHFAGTHIFIFFCRLLNENKTKKKNEKKNETSCPYNPLTGSTETNRQARHTCIVCCTFAMSFLVFSFQFFFFYVFMFLLLLFLFFIFFFAKTSQSGCINLQSTAGHIRPVRESCSSAGGNMLKWFCFQYDDLTGFVLIVWLLLLVCCWTTCL